MKGRLCIYYLQNNLNECKKYIGTNKQRKIRICEE